MIGYKYLVGVSVVLMSCIGIAHAETSSGDWLGKFYSWSCKYTNYGCERTIADLSKSRSGTRRPRGGALVSIDLKSRAMQTILADCKCWSPVPLKSGTVAVATATGIVEVPLDLRSKPRSILTSEDIRELVGTELRADHSLLFLRTSHAAGCEFEPWLLNPSTGSVEKVSASELPCGSNVGFQSLIKPSQSLHGRSVLTVMYHGQFEVDLQSKDGIEPLIPDRKASGQFDGVWIDSQTIVFVTER